MQNSKEKKLVNDVALLEAIRELCKKYDAKGLEYSLKRECGYRTLTVEITL